jgi:RNA polymerase sigma-70 factor (family 1)
LRAYKVCTDEELLSFLRKDDERAFAELFERYWKKARAMAYSRLSSEEITKEIVQDVFSSLWERRKTLHILNFSFYLSSAVKYKVINHIKHEAIHNRFTEYYKNFVTINAEQTLESVTGNELNELLESGLRKLPEKTQRVFRMSRFEGRSVLEIASSLNLSEKAIQYHISRSLRELRFYLRDFIVPFLLACFFRFIF